MAAAGDLKQRFADLQHGAARDFEVESTNREIPPDLFEVDRSAEQRLDRGEVLVLQESHRALFGVAVVSIGPEVPGVDLDGCSKPSRPNLNELDLPLRGGLFNTKSREAWDRLVPLRHARTLLERIAPRRGLADGVAAENSQSGL